MSNLTTFLPYTVGATEVTNRIVMAPMTRTRAIKNMPNELIATYYSQRASAGLIITEGISPSPNGLGYARMPGIFSSEQVEAWKQVTEAVHQQGGKIFAQLMHVGRIGSKLNLPKGATLVAPSAVQAPGQIYTDEQGMQEHDTPLALDGALLSKTKQEFVQAAIHAVAAGFDGIELHAANGYLLEQFLSPHTNQRTDNYGGSVENRIRFVVEVAEAVSNAIGKERVGIRVSPYGVYNDMPHYDQIDATYTLLAEKLNILSIAYIHVLDHSADGAPAVPTSIKEAIRAKFKNTIILAGGFTLAKAEEAIKSGLGDLVAFGKPFISNPDLVSRFRKGLPLNIKLDASTLYTPGAKGYTDYPVFAEELVSA